MPKMILILLAGLVAGLPLPSTALADDDARLLHRLLQKIRHHDRVVEFDETEIYLEQNFTDGNTEVVLVAQTEEFGLKKLWIFSPRGDLIYQFKSPANGSNIGGREVLVESPEPDDLDQVLAAYPEGDYTFIGRDFAGQWNLGVASLVHDIPPPASITFPPDGGSVPRFEFVVAWESAVVADSYLIELENQATDEELYVEIPATSNTFRAPEEWLVPGIEYQVSVSVINAHGNLTVVEQYTVVLD